ncbi:MAG: lysylphosphatidylglycerol synthase domain-containing protein [Acidimicrobiales bacterium]
MLYLVAVLGAAYFVFRSDAEQIGQYVRAVPAGVTLLAFGASLAALILSMAAWRATLAALGHTIPLRAASRVFFVSQMGKYLPGSVWPALVQAQMGRAHGVPRRVNLASFFLALLLALGTGVVVGTLFVAVALGGWWIVGAAASSAVAGLVWHMLGRWDRLLDLVPSRLARLLPDRAPARDRLAAAGGLLVLGWLCHGFQLYALARGLEASGGSLFLLSVGGFALAFVAGTLFIIAPAGAGVREAALLGLLGLAVEGRPALIAAIVLLARAVLSAADVALGVVAWLALGRPRSAARGSAG